MPEKQIVLLSNHSLLAAAVQKLLQREASLELSIVAADDVHAAETMRKLAPRVIILDSGDPSLGDGVIARILQEHPKAKVIALNLKQKGIAVYRMKRFLQADLDGLLEAIQGDVASAKQRRLKQNLSSAFGPLPQTPSPSTERGQGER